MHTLQLIQTNIMLHKNGPSEPDLGTIKMRPRPVAPATSILNTSDSMGFAFESELKTGYFFWGQATAHVAVGRNHAALDNCKYATEACKAARASYIGQLPLDRKKELDELLSDLKILRRWASTKLRAR